MPRYEVWPPSAGETWTVYDKQNCGFVAQFNEEYPESEQRARDLCDFLNTREEATTALAGEMVRS